MTGQLGSPTHGFTSPRDAMSRWRPGAASADAMPTGITDLDDLLGGGLKPGQVTVIASDTGMGKTCFALNLVRHCSLRLGRPSAFFSLGTTSEQDLRTRVLSAESRVRWRDLVDPTHLTDADRATLGEATTGIGRSARLAHAWKVLGAILTPCSVSTRQIGTTPKRSLASAMKRQISAVVSDVSAGRSPARRKPSRP